MKDSLRYRQHRPRHSLRGYTPQIVPNYIPIQLSLSLSLSLDRVVALREYMCFLADNMCPNFTSLASDDLAVILDSGCAIAMTDS